MLLAESPASAAGTNIAISTAAAASGSYVHARGGRVDWRIVAWMGPPSITGAVVGALGSDVLPEGALLVAIALVLAWNGVDLIARPVAPRPREQPSGLRAVGFGFAIGVIGGAVGVILGTLRMPALLGSIGLPTRLAVGTNLVVGFLLGLFGFLAHALELEVEWGLLAAGLAGAVIGAWLGARLTGRASERTLRVGIGVAMLAVSAAFAAQLAASRI